MTRRGRRSERGAAAVIIGTLMSLVLLAIAAFAVDLGMQRVVRRDMQAVADVAALDLARLLEGKKASEYTAGDFTAALAESLDRNKDAIGDDVGAIGSCPGAEISADAGACWEFVRRDGGAWVALATGSAAVPEGVRVKAKSTVGFAFGGITDVGAGSATRSAVAQSEGGACFRIGSYAARLDTSQSPLLGPLLGALGSDVTLSAVDYNGLANAEVKLVDLVGAKVGALTVDEVLAGSQLLSLGDFYLATAEALNGANTASIALLESLAASVGGAQLRLGDILGLATGTGHGLDAGLNVLDLVTAAASAATGEAGLSIPQANVNLGPLANVSVDLEVIKPLKQGCGRKNDPNAQASSTQVEVNLASSLLSLNLGIGRTEVKLSGSVELAQANGLLTDVRCGPPGATVKVSDGLLEIDLTLEVKVFALGIPIVGGPIRISGHTDSAGDAVLNITSDADYDNPVTVPNESSGLPSLHTNVSGVKLIGLPLGVVLAPIVNGLLGGIVNPLVSSLDDALLVPLLRTLGLDLSGADVYLNRVPKCDAPKLVG